MNIIKKFLTLVGMGVMCISISACSMENARKNGINLSSSGNGETISIGPDLTGKDFSDYRIGISLADCTSNTYCTAYVQAINSYVSELGVDATVFDAFGDPGQQAAQIKTLINMDMDLIILWPSNSNSAVSWVRSINKAGIPVIIANTGVDTDGEQYIEGFIGPSCVEEGYLTACRMMADLENQGNIVVINGQDNYAPVKERRKGLKDAIAASKIKVIEEYNDEGQRSVAKTFMEECFRQHQIGEIDAIFCYDDEAAMGAFDAMKSMDRKDEMKVYVAATGNYATIAYIQEGAVSATAIQSPIVDAKTTLGYSLDFLLGNPLPEFFNYIDTPVITSANIDTLNITPWES